MAKDDPLTPTRRERLREFCRAQGWVKDNGDWATGAIADRLKKAPNKVSDLLRGKGSFGAKMARDLEMASDGLMPIGYLDGLTDQDGAPRSHAPGYVAQATAGELAMALARAYRDLDDAAKRSITHNFAEMIWVGPEDRFVSAIDAVATVVVSLPAAMGDMRPESPPIRANHDDQNHNLVETGSSKSNESITVPPAPSQVMGTPPGADKETGKPWKELGTLVGGTGPDRRQSKEWTTPEKPKSGRRRKT